MAGNPLGHHLQADGVRDAAQTFQEGGISGVAVESADEARIDLQEVESEIVQLTDLAEVVAEGFEADTAADRLGVGAECAELGQVLERAAFRNLQPEA